MSVICPKCEDSGYTDLDSLNWCRDCRIGWSHGAAYTKNLASSYEAQARALRDRADQLHITMVTKFGREPRRSEGGAS